VRGHSRTDGRTQTRGVAALPRSPRSPTLRKLPPWERAWLRPLLLAPLSLPRRGSVARCPDSLLQHAVSLEDQKNPAPLASMRRRSVISVPAAGTPSRRQLAASSKSLVLVPPPLHHEVCGRPADSTPFLCPPIHWFGVPESAVLGLVLPLSFPPLRNACISPRRTCAIVPAHLNSVNPAKYDEHTDRNRPPTLSVPPIYQQPLQRL
jgi:hypothetical protein